MLRQDRQSDTITRKQEEEEGGGSEVKRYIERVKGRVGGLKAGPKKSWDTQTIDTEVLSLIKVWRETERETERKKRHKTLGKEGDKGSCSPSFCFFLKAFLRWCVSLLQCSWKEKGIISSQNLVLLKSSTAICSNGDCERQTDRQREGERGVSSVRTQQEGQQINMSTDDCVCVCVINSWHDSGIFLFYSKESESFVILLALQAVTISPFTCNEVFTHTCTLFSLVLTTWKSFTLPITNEPKLVYKRHMNSSAAH